MRSAVISVTFLVVATGQVPPAVADAQDALELPRARLDMRAAGALRDDLVSRDGRRIDTRGGALSRLSLDGSWLASTAPVGVASHLQVERFGVRGDDLSGGAVDTVATAFEAGAGLLGRLPGSDARRGVEGQLGYAVVRLPVAAVRSPDQSMPALAPVSVDVLSVTTHGPQLGARGWLRAGAGVTVEADVRALPRGLSARYADESIRLWRASAGAGVLFGRFEAAGIRWAGRLGYELAATGADGDEGSIEIRQKQHVVGIGVRAGFLLPTTTATSERADDRQQPDKTLRNISGVVRRAGPATEGGGMPLAGVEVAVLDGPRTRTDAAGRFVLEGVPPGLTQLRLHHDGFLPGEEVVSVSSDGEVRIEALLRPLVVSRPATINGVVRSETGVSLDARVRVLERNEDTHADKDGRFHLELPPGRYTLVIEAPGFGRQERRFEIGAGEQRIYNVDLKAVP